MYITQYNIKVSIFFSIIPRYNPYITLGFRLRAIMASVLKVIYSTRVNERDTVPSQVNIDIGFREFGGNIGRMDKKMETPVGYSGSSA